MTTWRGNDRRGFTYSNGDEWTPGGRMSPNDWIYDVNYNGDIPNDANVRDLNADNMRGGPSTPWQKLPLQGGAFSGGQLLPSHLMTPNPREGVGGAWNFQGQQPPSQSPSPPGGQQGGFNQGGWGGGQNTGPGPFGGGQNGPPSQQKSGMWGQGGGQGPFNRGTAASQMLGSIFGNWR